MITFAEGIHILTTQKSYIQAPTLPLEVLFELFLILWSSFLV